MTHEQKITYMRIATNICRFGFDDRHLDLLVRLYELVQEKKGEATLSDTITIEADVKRDHDAIQKQNLLDKVSDKIE